MHTLSYIYMCNIGFIHELGRNVAWYGCHYRRCFMIYQFSYVTCCPVIRIYRDFSQLILILIFLEYSYPISSNFLLITSVFHYTPSIYTKC